MLAFWLRMYGRRQVGPLSSAGLLLLLSRDLALASLHDSSCADRHRGFNFASAEYTAAPAHITGGAEQWPGYVPAVGAKCIRRQAVRRLDGAAIAVRPH